MSEYDAIVVGAGAGGGVAAGVLAQRGARVLLLERGRWLDFERTGRDHLRNHRLSLYGHNTGPDLVGSPRVAVGLDGSVAIVEPHQPAYQNNASAVGSGTLVYGGQAWRFHPLDFRMASEYGVPAGSSLADWPITYEDLALYYRRIEIEVGVCGGPAAPEVPWRENYPMPPLPLPEKGRRLASAAGSLGWDTQRVPLLINSVPRDNRPACVYCQHCVGFACPVDAKNGTQNTMISRGLATGNLTVATEAVAVSIERRDGRAVGVQYVQSGTLRSVSADHIVVAAGAIESARLLMLSGLGTDAVGRNLQGHYYQGAFGIFPDPVWDGVGPGASVATLRFTHGNDGIVGGALLADDFIATPISFARLAPPPDIPTWGKGHKDWMRHAYPRFVSAVGPVQEIPHPECRVTIDPWVRDGLGLPVARLSGSTHPETLRTAEFINEVGQRWLKAAGCERIWSHAPTLRLSAGQHQAGTCRMGENPATSVVDAWGRVHGVTGLYIADGSVHVTNGAFNPVLTIMATACRTADHIGVG